MTSPHQPNQQESSPAPNAPIDAIYHTDPLCGWCFAIAEELAAARKSLGAEVQWTIRMGGLVVGERVRPIRNDAHYLRDGLASVAQLSGRVASAEYFERVLDVGTWVSNSETVCRAVLTAIELGGTEAGFIASHFLSDTLYVEGLEPDAGSSVEALAVELDLDVAKFVGHWEADRTRDALALHWAETRRLGLTTYPTIAVTRQDGSVDDLITGFADRGTIIETLRSAGRPASR